MGRIKSALIKRTAQKLMTQIDFKNNFEENQEFITNTMPSKRIQNMVAGYITKKTKILQKSQSSHVD